MSDPAITDRLLTRHVIFSYTHGIYLGPTCWSHINPGFLNVAPTFSDEEIGATLKEIGDAEKVGPVEYRLVWPSKGEMASVEDCANAGLPRWGETGLPVQQVYTKRRTHPTDDPNRTEGGES